jgi:HTH-type transcriptional repressor of NAD biosynthesis genes
MTPRSVLILGAQGSGKSWLTQALSVSLETRGFCVTIGTSALASMAPTPTIAAPAHWLISEALQPPAVLDPLPTTLLMGLDLPGLDSERQRQDSLLRQTLDGAQIPFRVVYGTGVDRLNNALLALGLAGEDACTGRERESLQFNINAGRDAWTCNACSDPGCEHRLFTGLLAKRSD